MSGILRKSEVDEEGRDPQREAFEKYRQSDKGKKSVAVYNSTLSAKESRRRYAASDKGRLAMKRWRLSASGKDSLEKRRTKKLLVLDFARLEEQGLCGFCGSAEHAAEYHVKVDGHSADSE